MRQRDESDRSLTLMRRPADHPLAAGRLQVRDSYEPDGARGLVV